MVGKLVVFVGEVRICVDFVKFNGIFLMYCSYNYFNLVLYMFVVYIFNFIILVE